MKSSPIKIKTYTGPDGGKQKLSSAARKRKQERDKASAMTKKRKDRKKDNQARVQRSDSDLHHAPDGSVRRVPIRKNRGNFGKGTKNE